MNDFIKTTVPGLIKNKKTRTIINTNVGEYKQVLAGRKRNKEFQLMKQEISQLREQINYLTRKIAEMT